MNQIKFLSREKLVEYLDEEVRLFLNDKGIYEINQYGWLTDDRPDPEYLGHAMWQAEPPGRPQITAISDSAMVSGLYPADPAKIAEAGIAFEGLMRTARHSIGLTSLYHGASSPMPEEANFSFWYHYSDTVLKLNMATDRLRDFFMAAFSTIAELDDKTLSPSTDVHKTNKGTFFAFCLPFYRAKEALHAREIDDQELASCLDGLIPLAEQTAFYRIDGKDLCRNLAMFNEQVINTVAAPATAKLDAPDPTGHFFDSQAAIHEVAQWYKTLIETSNQIFMAEFLLRTPLPEDHI